MFKYMSLLRTRSKASFDTTGYTEERPRVESAIVHSADLSVLCSEGAVVSWGRWNGVLCRGLEICSQYRFLWKRTLRRIKIEHFNP